jgi:hypothetical protein
MQRAKEYTGNEKKPRPFGVEAIGDSNGKRAHIDCRFPLTVEKGGVFFFLVGTMPRGRIREVSADDFLCALKNEKT